MSIVFQFIILIVGFVMLIKGADWFETGGIALAVFLATLISTLSEYGSEAAFERLSARFGRRQFVVPYIISAFPGCTAADMRACADWFHRQGWQPQQVQCFIPTPGTMATAMYYGQCDADGRPLQVATTDRERLEQHGLLFRDDERPRSGGRRGGQVQRRARRP